ncbi:phenylacetate--CoA ligase family protein [Chondromyces apiculatus]|uniref:Coenzyme F390 synthetase n=1 Tax=Chondromyces apiculatus DSM 436 TaxID=1192034 RepID=A0A017THQ8_9BACT|nr:phenylacetate--CoA ligase family protein [Chondromyces apiculatus]EYF08432.1 Coenzyme F390 synthetase [Chondromyces apiculatus DSM 436]
MNKAQRQRFLAAINHHFATSLDETLSRHHDVDPATLALALFQEVAASVPAYGRFLAERGLDAAAVQSHEAFRVLPVLTKQTYVLANPIADLCRGGRLEDCDMVAVSSGSTGRPTFWPRFVTDELPVTRRFEQIFHDSFEADRRRTLAVICFAMGTWVGGMYTTAACRHLAARGYPITVITPGNNKDEIFRAIEELGPAFDQVVLLGYPPFLKDVIDAGLVRGIDWSPLNIKLVFAGEVFSEEWRTLVLERAGSKDPYRDSASMYGTADAGVLAVETPLSIAIRRHLARYPDVARELFGQERLPTLLQYDPCARYFEAIDGMLVFTGDGGTPLVRYAILDQGGVIPHDTMLSFLARRSFHPLVTLSDGRGMRDMPFVYVFGRSDFTVSYFGANVYPENVSVGLEQPTVSAHVTGKFVMEVREEDDHNPILVIRIELAPGEEPSDLLQNTLAQAIQAELLRLNSEYKTYVPEGRHLPRVLLLPTGDPTYFPVGVKHRYTRKPTPAG